VSSSLTTPNILGGFLGSGKTSLLISIAKKIAAAGNKIAIIENEAGKTGVDSLLLSEEGLEVREIFSGYICCSLRIDLAAALHEIETTIKPDVVFLEPSGIASPKQVINAIEGYSGNVECIFTAVIIDAFRFAKLASLNIPIITDGIDAADIIAVNKSDLVEQEVLDRVFSLVKSHRPGAPLTTVSALTGRNIDDLVKPFLELCGKSGRKNSEALNHVQGEGHKHVTQSGLEAVAISRQYTLSDNSKLHYVWYFRTPGRRYYQCVFGNRRLL